MGAGGPTDVQEVLSLGTPPPASSWQTGFPERIAARRNDTFETTGAGRTRSTTTAAAGTAPTFAFSMENDATVSDALSIQWPAARHPARSDTWPVVLDPAEE